jgi:hypothetical protein
MKNIPVRNGSIDFLAAYQFLGAEKEWAVAIFCTMAEALKFKKIRHHAVEQLRIAHFYFTLDQLGAFHFLSPPLGMNRFPGIFSQVSQRLFQNLCPSFVPH